MAVKAIFVTHEHIDHIKGVRVLASRHNIKVYATKGAASGLPPKPSEAVSVGKGGAAPTVHPALPEA